MAASAHVFDATQQSFETDVIEASFQQPVLVDFWAEWCGPCKALGPILEKLADEYAGGFKLAKVDTDKEMAIAQMAGIRSLPTVMMFRDGQIIDGFMGAVPESAVRELLQRHGVAPGAASGDEPVLDEVEPTEAETPEQTIARLQQAIAAKPDDASLKLDLALALMQAGNADAAATELDALPDSLVNDARAKRLRSQLDLSRALAGAPSLGELRARVERDTNDFEARDLLGVRQLLEGEVEAGLEQFLSILKADRAWNEGRAKKRLIAAFEVLDDAELVGTYRRKMSSLLF